MNRSRITLAVLPFLMGLSGIGAMVPSGTPMAVRSILSASLPSAYQPIAVASVSVAPSDTIAAGSIFITQLPDSLDGQAIASYSADRLPLKSWLLERSFMWSTSHEDRGEHIFELRAHPEQPQSNGDSTGSFIPWSLTLMVQ